MFGAFVFSSFVLLIVSDTLSERKTRWLNNNNSLIKIRNNDDHNARLG